MLQAKDILFTSWEEIPLRKLPIILQLLPLIRWDIHTHWGNTYLKNFLLKQLFRSRKIYLKTTPEQRVDLYTHELEWMRELSPKFHLPKLSIDGHTFTAPRDGMTDLRLEVLAEADTRLSRYMISERSEYLHAFIAAVYSSGQAWDPDTLTTNAAILGKIEEWKKVSIIRSFVGAREVLTKSLPDLFPEQSRPSEDKEKKSKKIKAQDTGPLWDALIYDLAGTAGFPGVETAKRANAWEALSYLNHEIKKARKK
jgi:hypothetical protein